ncbi:universal stress protein [Halorarius halobius]|uniref:universal stress protein n=1 Tax=Halorarius halobius TaxID=2962671 RepID=UPI0020CCD86C|nr:universal stress protein [Halorarius halobius]
MYDRIIIAVDGSEEAEHAARHGLAFAAAVDASVDVLHVVPRGSLQLTRSDDERSRLRERGEAALSAVESLAADFDRQVTTTLVEGRPARRISEHATEAGADLVVVGRQGTTGLGRRLIGGVTESVLHRSDVPVFVVPGGDGVAEGTEYDRLLVPTDGSENAAAATRHGAAIARPYGAEIHVLNVVDLQAAGGVFSAGGLEREFVQRLEARGREAVDGVVADFEALDADLDVRPAVERTTSFDGAAAGIREYVDANDIDLVVMGSHGRSNLQRQLLGSVASTVLRTVDVPVVVVKRSG